LSSDRRQCSQAGGDAGDGRTATGSGDERLRYARQATLTELGPEGHARIRAGSALIVGVGGLGCPAATYLAGAGVGRLVLTDFDRVDLTNLHRQILFETGDVGRAKVEAATDRIARINPDVEVEGLDGRLDAAGLAETIGRCDVVLDGSDNFGTRFAVNRAARRAGKPLVSGATIRMEGQLAVFDPRRPDTPCYRCLYDEDGEELENCTGAGILGPVAGVMGCLMAVEALKILAGCGESVAGRLLLYDALDGRWRELRVPPDPDCPVCGSQTSATT
jgi:adenylyltransferase/sulfurtransferase